MRGKAKLLLCTVLTVLLLVLSLPMAEAQTYYFNTGGQSFQGELYYGKYDKQVETIKQQLKKLGYYQGFITSWFNPELERAVKDFQRDFKLTISGRVDRETYSALFQGKTNKAPEQKQVPEKTIPQPDQDWNKGTTTTYSQKNYKVDVRRDGNRLTIYYRLFEEQPAPQPAPNPDPQLQPNPVPVPVPAPEPQPEPVPAPVPRPQPEQGLTAMEQQMVDLVNQERSANGLQPLKVDLDLVRTARMKSQDMIDNNYFAHESPVYGSPFELMRNQGVSYRYAGENLAGAPTVQRAHTALMNSPGHRANILNPNYTHVGIGIIPGGSYGMMVTQHFVGR